MYRVRPDQVKMEVIKDIYTDDLGTTTNYDVTVTYLLDNDLIGRSRERNKLTAIHKALTMLCNKIDARSFEYAIPEGFLIERTVDRDGF